MPKKVIQVYKNFDQWTNSPPGLGDFIRGCCHLHEMLSKVNIEFKIDISQSDFSHHILHNPNVFSTQNATDITHAAEYFTDHNLLINDLNQFLQNDKECFFVCTNIGNWNRLELPEATKAFVLNLFNFKDTVSSYVSSHIPLAIYEVLSIRCGDRFYGEANLGLDAQLEQHIFQMIEQSILPNLKHPLVVTSDSFRLKSELAEKYGFLMLPHHSEHGAFNSSAYPVCLDMCLLKNSKFNYHINLWANWWSGFSHYTSLVFSIPSMNFRAPEFVREVLS